MRRRRLQPRCRGAARRTLAATSSTPLVHLRNQLPRHAKSVVSHYKNFDRDEMRMMEVSVNPVVVGVDGTDNALGSALWAAAIASKLGAPLHIVHARPYPGHNLSDAVAVARASEMAAAETAAPAILAAAERAVRRSFGELRITTANVS